MSDIGDLSFFLREGSIVDHDWLDESKNPQNPALPKPAIRNIKPELEALWGTDPDPSVYSVPNQARAVRTTSTATPLIAAVPDDDRVSRVARLAMMQSDELGYLRSELYQHIDVGTIQRSRTALATVLAERGLIGKLYVEASDFPRCSSDPKVSIFVRRYAAKALFIRMKSACRDCTQARGSRCSVFQKVLVPEVPYSDSLAKAIEQDQSGSEKQASGTVNPKERIRAAFLAPSSAEKRLSSEYSGQPNVASKIIPTGRLTQKTAAAKEAELLASKARPMIELLRREMLKGRSAREVAQALRLAFDPRDLKSLQPAWSKLAAEHGLYGTVYTTQDSFDSCHEGADFLARHGSKVKAVVSGEKCGSCVYSAAGFCQVYGRKLVAKAEELFTEEVVKQAIWEQKLAGRIPAGTSDKIIAQWGSDPKSVLAAIYRAATEQPRKTPVLSTTRSVVERAHTMSPLSSTHVANQQTKQRIVKTARRYLNEGLYGSDLGRALRQQFDLRDIKAAFEELKPYLAEQGLQGIKYVDPTVYVDYGKGCKEAQSLHRSRLVTFVKAGSKCGSCVHQTRPGYCSVLNKDLVLKVPYVDKYAEQQAILNSGPSTKIEYASLMNNGLSMMAEYELQNRPIDIDVGAPPPVTSVAIELSGDQIFEI